MGVKNGQRRRQGMAMVEMVIIAPLLLMLIFAIAEFGVMFGRWQNLSNAAREGARTAVVFRTACNSTTVETEVRTRVKTYAASLGMAVADGDITVTGACAGANTNAVVNVTHAHTFSVLPNLATSLSSAINLVGSSTMRNEG
jgi:Flp pilus assembly protein TadG